MVTKTEGRHAAEFVLSEANGMRSRASGTVLTGRSLVVGEVVQDNGAGKLVAFTGDTDTAGDLITEAAGILLYAADATDADVDVAYLARDAEVNLNELTYPAETTGGNEEANTIASLKKLGIVAR